MNRQSYAIHPQPSSIYFKFKLYFYVLLLAISNFHRWLFHSLLSPIGIASPALSPTGIGNTCFPFDSMLNCTKSPSPGHCQMSSTHWRTHNRLSPTNGRLFHKFPLLETHWFHAVERIYAQALHFRRFKSCSMISLLAFEWPIFHWPILKGEWMI